jgi:hypothetical protein
MLQIRSADEPMTTCEPCLFLQRGTRAKVHALPLTVFRLVANAPTCGKVLISTLDALAVAINGERTNIILGLKLGHITTVPLESLHLNLSVLFRYEEVHCHDTGSFFVDIGSAARNAIAHD